MIASRRCERAKEERGRSPAQSSAGFAKDDGCYMIAGLVSAFASTILDDGCADRCVGCRKRTATVEIVVDALGLSMVIVGPAAAAFVLMVL
jgi:hypothetical protein